MNNCELRKLNINDDRAVFDMLQEIPKDENGFINSVNGKSYEEFREWLIRSDELSKKIGLIDGWKVPSNIYWLYVDDYPVGIAKLRHFLTGKLKEEGGHAGYAIRQSERNKGYGKLILKLLIEEAKKLNIDKLLLTIRSENTPSIKVAIDNHGEITKSDGNREYVWIDCL